jgi:hypothetical protein
MTRTNAASCMDGWTQLGLELEMAKKPCVKAAEAVIVFHESLNTINC